jgi:hypothetical protein
MKMLNSTLYAIGATLVAAVVISVLVAMNINAKLSAVRSELASSKVMYSLVVKEKMRLDSLIGFYTHSVALRDSVIAIKDREITKQVASIVALENRLKGLQVELSNVTADSSYKFINERIVPTAEQKYGFDSIQVKTIHYTFLERDQLTYLNLKNSLVIGDLLSASKLKDSQIRDLNELNSLMLSKEAILKKEQESNKVAIEGLNDNIKQQKRQKNWLIGGVAGVATIIIIKSLAQ